jgi:hypothetical protein
MMLHLYWRKLTVNQAVLVRETLPLILHYLRGSTGKHVKSQRKGLDQWNYTSPKTLFEDGNAFKVIGCLENEVYTYQR